MKRKITPFPYAVMAEWVRPKRNKEYIDYKEYVASEEWQNSKRRKQCIKDADNKCQMCGIGFGLEVHHVHYQNLGKEKPDQLVLLCVLCHEYTHKMAGKGAKYYPPLRRPNVCQ